MTRNRALVVGSELPPLRGTNHDAAAMQALLAARGFEVVKLVDAAASRSGILAAFDALIADTDPGDAAVFYFAGHGGYAYYPDAAPGHRSQIQCIFPFDWTAAGETDAAAFRAILDVELSERLRRLTEKTRNATVILDCCHASEMARGPGTDVDPDLVPRFYGPGWARLAPAFLAANPVDLSRLDAESNPHAVRVVASAADRQSFELSMPSPDGPVRRGLFTVMLERALAESARTPRSWQAILGRVRELVAQRTRDQTPGVEGPADRLPFSEKVLRRSDAVVFAYDDGVPCLRANRLLGAVVGAKYDIMPVADAERVAERVVAHATVVELVGPNARVDLELTAAGRRPEAGALAFPTTLPYPPIQVAIVGPAGARLAAEIRTPLVDGRPRRIEVVADRRLARFCVEADGERLSTTAVGLVARTALDDTDAGRARLIQWLERWSKADAVTALATEGLPPSAIEIRWGRVESGQAIPHGPGAALHVGERAYVTVTSRWDEPLWVAIFDLGIAGKVTLVTSAADGRKLARDQSFTLGRRDASLPITGHGPVTWADEVPRTAPGPDGVERPVPRRESLVVIAATAPTDFRRLENEPLDGRGPGNGLRRFEAVLDGLRTGGARDFGGGDELDGVCIHRIDFDVFPFPRAAAPAPG